MPADAMPRVGYVLKRYPRYSETFVVNEILAHEAAGLDIVIFALRPPADQHFQDLIARVRAPVIYLPNKGVKVVDLWEGLSEAGRTLPDFWARLAAAQGEEARDVYQAVFLALEIVRRGIEHLHAHFATSATTVSRLAACFTGISYTFTAHAKDIFHESVQHDDLRCKLVSAATTVTVSDFNLNYLRETYGAAAAHVQRIYNGLPLECFRYESPGTRPARIVAVGRLVEKKGFGDLLEACAILRDRGRIFDCLIVGTGELEETLRAHIERLALQDCVQLLGPRPQYEIVELVQGAAVLAAPCVIGFDNNCDGLPTVLLEAMALGTPCVSTDVTGIPEVLHDGETGLMVPQHDPPALAAAIERLLTEPALRVSIAERARQRIERDFDVHHNAARVRSLFRAHRTERV